MSAHPEEWLDLCAGYALDDLSAADRRRLEEHLEHGCAACEETIADCSSATVTLARSAPAGMPSRALRERVLIAAGSVRHPMPSPEPVGEGTRAVALEPPRRREWVSYALYMAAALLLYTALSQWHQGSLLRRELAEARRWSPVMDAPGARFAEFRLTPAGAADLRARAAYDPGTRRAVLVFENFKAPPGSEYELWAIHGTQPSALGLIRPDAAGRAVMRLEDAGDPRTLAAFAVSLEPAGGAPAPGAPRGPVVLVASIGR
ncbi:MAG: anti-sigma factor [Candidatus Eisenbacteria bacterium]|nr:anti-sigma factor [Candidatus Eisenbacteria bacterium]